MLVTVIGIGKVGLAYATFLAEKGHAVTGIDLNEQYVKSLQDGTFECPEPGVQEHIGRLTYKTKDDTQAEICVVLVDTPTCYAGYDHANLERVLQDVVKKGHERIIVSCTTQPGFMKKWPNVYYSPLFIQLGNIVNHQKTTKNILVGGQPDAKISEFFRINHGEDAKVHYMAPTAAEVAKLALNCMITTKISFANMISEALWRSGYDHETDNVLDFVGSDPRIGDKCLKAGWGYGGPCFPRDNRALCTFLREWGASDYIPIATHETNERHAVVMAMKNVDPSEFLDLNYKPDCPVVCTEESHKVKTLQIKKFLDNK